jgi:hypothetical protein
LRTVFISLGVGAATDTTSSFEHTLLEDGKAAFPLKEWRPFSKNGPSLAREIG